MLAFDIECMSEKFRRVLEATPFQAPSVPVVANATAGPLTDPAEIREAVAKQLTSPVHWTDSMRWLLEQGVTSFVEVGPKDVLTGLMKRIDRNAERLTTTEMQTMSTFTDAGWDFVGETANGTDDIWTICNGGDYPRLTWQFVIGDFDGDNNVNFRDFAFLAALWLQADNSFWCGGDGTDLTNDGDVGYSDLKHFSENWLVGIDN